MDFVEAMINAVRPLLIYDNEHVIRHYPLHSRLKMGLVQSKKRKKYANLSVIYSSQLIDTSSLFYLLLYFLIETITNNEQHLNTFKSRHLCDKVMNWTNIHWILILQHIEAGEADNVQTSSLHLLLAYRWSSRR